MRQIIAMGGGGFTMEPGNPLLDDYVLQQSKAKNPRICFLPTASSDNMELIEAFYDFFMTRDCSPSHLPLLNPPTRNLEKFLMANDIIYVGGGHTGHMLSLWRASGVDGILKKAWNKGIILAGVSAGASCWFEVGLTDSVPDQLTGERCLGFLKGSHCAHYENPGRRPVFHDLIEKGTLPGGYGTENFAALHFVDDKLKRVVCSRPGAATYSVTRALGGAVEKKIEGVEL
jgi:dipeptidase E